MPQGKSREEMIRIGKNTTFSKERPPTNPGRTKGARNRSTIVKWVLELPADMISPGMEFIELTDPKTGEKIPVDTEMAMAIRQAQKAITLADTPAFLALSDSAYGKAKTVIEQPESHPVSYDYSTFSEDELQTLARLQRKALGLNADGSQKERPGTTDADIIAD